MLGSNKHSHRSIQHLLHTNIIFWHRSTLVVYIVQTDCITVSTLLFQICNLDAVDYGFDIFFYFEIDNLPTCNFLAEAAVTLCKNKKIAILAPTPNLNLTQTLTLTLISTQTQNLTQTLTIIKKIRVNEHWLFALIISLWALRNLTLATSNFSYIF